MKSLTCSPEAFKGGVESVLKAYLRANPTSALQKNPQTGQLPLHQLLTWWATLPAAEQAQNVKCGVVAWLLKSNPQSLFEADEQGNTPLHLVVKIDDRYGINTLHLLYSGAKCVCLYRNNEGLLPIQMAIECSQYEYIKHFLRQDYCSMNAQVPGLLKLAIAFEVRTDVTEELVQVNPKCTTQVDQDGLLPIQYALATGTCSVNAIRALAKIYPEALSVEDQDGNLPLHVAAAKYRGHSPADRALVLSHIGAAFPMAYSTENNNGELPLHLAVVYESSATADHFQSIRVLKALTLGYPQAHRAADNNGNLPMHLASSCLRNDFKLLSFLIDQNLAGLRTINYNGCFPLHLAAQGNISVAAVEYLIDQYPQAVLKQDCDGNLPLHHAVRSRQCCRHECAQLLVRRGPEAVRHTNLKGELPWQVACCSTPAAAAATATPVATSEVVIEIADETCPAPWLCDADNSCSWINDVRDGSDIMRSPLESDDDYDADGSDDESDMSLCGRDPF